MGLREGQQGRAGRTVQRVERVDDRVDVVHIEHELGGSSLDGRRECRGEAGELEERHGRWGRRAG